MSLDTLAPAIASDPAALAAVQDVLMDCPDCDGLGQVLDSRDQWQACDRCDRGGELAKCHRCGMVRPTAVMARPLGRGLGSLTCEEWRGCDS